MDGEELRGLAGRVPGARILHDPAQELRPDHQGPYSRDDQDQRSEEGQFHWLVAFQPGLCLLGLQVQGLGHHGLRSIGDLPAEERHR